MELLPGIHLVETSGYVTGHQSVLLRLPNTSAVLLSIDAMGRGDLSGAREKVPVIFAHDAAQWQTLRHIPEYYD